MLVTLTHPRVGCTAVLWSPRRTKGNRETERIEREATKMAPNLKELPCEERSVRMGLSTLEKNKGEDMIAVFQKIKGINKVDINYIFIWDEEVTCHDKKQKKIGKKKISFPCRCTDIMEQPRQSCTTRYLK